jgi:hypothetical protein
MNLLVVNDEKDVEIMFRQKLRKETFRVKSNWWLPFPLCFLFFQ